MKRMTGRIAVAAVCFGALAACEDFLVVDQTQQPEAATIFDSDSDFENALGSSFSVMWGLMQGSRQTNSEYHWPVHAMSMLGEEQTAQTNSTTGHVYVQQIPRIEYDNDQAGGNWLFRRPWYQSYQAIAIATDAMHYLENNPDRRIYDQPGPDGLDKTERAIWFAKFMRAIGHMYLGMYFDQAYPIPNEFDTQNPNYDFASLMRSHSEVTQAGIDLMNEAIEYMKNAPIDTLRYDTVSVGTQQNLLQGWMNVPNGSTPFTNARLIEIGNSLIARAMVYNARTPSQRAAVNWNEVLSYLDEGITQDWAVQGEQRSGSATTSNSGRMDSQYLRRMLLAQSSNSSTVWRVNNLIVGPADTSGAFQAWYNAPLGQKDHFVVHTADKRIHGVATSSRAGFREPGVYFMLKETNCTSSTASSCMQDQIGNPAGTGTAAPNRFVPRNSTTSGGVYRRSLYAARRWGTSHWNTEPIVTMSVKEMNFLRAEAHLRLGNTQQAADIINAQGRTSIGGLPAVSASGTGSLPTCIPRKFDNGACGDLWDALMYEKRIETFGIEPMIPFADARGWGLMSELGTICQFAPPGRELEVIGMAYYTFGGNAIGSVGRAPAMSGAKCSDQ